MTVYSFIQGSAKELAQGSFNSCGNFYVFVHEEGAQNQDQGNLNLVFEQTLNPQRTPCGTRGES